MIKNKLRLSKYIDRTFSLFLVKHMKIENSDNSLCVGTKVINCVGIDAIIVLSCKNGIASSNWFNYIERTEKCNFKVWSVDLRELEKKYGLTFLGYLPIMVKYG